MCLHSRSSAEIDYMMETFTFTQFPADRSKAYVALYSEVSNAGELRKRIVEAAGKGGEEGERAREAVNFSFIDARLITSLLHLQTAIYQALLSDSQASLRTRTVHSEILWALNPTNNITDALRRYGVSEKTTALLVVRIGGEQDPAAVKTQMNGVVSGKEAPLSALESLTDWGAIRKYYKLPKEGQEVVNEIVVSSVAMKSVMA